MITKLYYYFFHGNIQAIKAFFYTALKKQLGNTIVTLFCKICIYTILMILLFFCYRFIVEHVIPFFISLYESFNAPSVQINDTPKIETPKEIPTDASSKGISKKTIIIGLSITTAVVVCGVGVLFIPGVPELIVSTVVLCTTSGGFGGA
jgi:uncharacterized membrane protein